MIQFRNEYELESWLIRILEKAGWSVQRQVDCDETRNWGHPYRADLIVDCPYENLSPILIELKYSKQVQGGSIYAQAFHQLYFKYRGRHFTGRKPKLYALAIFNESEDYVKYNHDQHSFLRGFFTYFGLGFMDLNNAPENFKIEFDNRKWGKIKLTDDGSTIPAKILKKVEKTSRFLRDP